jgi:uncharacterized protein YndB with AHSA1/START domain
MSEKFTAKAFISINATPAKVWDALINPEIIKKYFFGVETISDWKEGSSIIYRGQWEGKTFEDKGKIIKIEPEQLLATTYWSGFSGLPDAPENYQNVTYKLSSGSEVTNLEITQDGIPTSEAADHSQENWNKVLSELKKILEEGI